MFGHTLNTPSHRITDNRIRCKGRLLVRTNNAEKPQSSCSSGLLISDSISNKQAFGRLPAMLTQDVVDDIGLQARRAENSIKDRGNLRLLLHDPSELILRSTTDLNGELMIIHHLTNNEDRDLTLPQGLNSLQSAINVGAFHNLLFDKFGEQTPQLLELAFRERLMKNVLVGPLELEEARETSEIKEKSCQSVNLRM